ncbi:4Fe-4S ferredoxin [Nostoc cycadae WK-1]|uniref:4Fe-4S ferredoxin n=2 Tax=Nostoc cycadae TaxID=246795 RepID=A0A2H6LAR7_9NOSO|nr:4Fe-4S ferredoxin [Nostoc cycadae WK-1]
MVISTGVDAVEIHTQVGRLKEFQKLWQAISPWAEQLKLLAISCPDGEGMIEYLNAIYDLINPRPRTLIWQTDGRPMSGDIGDGTTLAAVKLGQKVLTANLPGYVQLAGGTNSYTVAKLKAMGLLKEAREQGSREARVKDSSLPSAPLPLCPSASIAGVAYGSYARVLLSPVLEQLENKEVNHTSVKATVHLEAEPDLLWEAVGLAHSLVSQIKSQQER